MLKLKELLELDGMKYSDTIKEKHKKRMKREMVYLNNPIIPHNPPPANSSRETLKELHWLRDFNDGLVNEILVKEGDDVKGAFREHLESQNLEYPKKYVKELIKFGIGLGAIILFLIIYYAILNPMVNEKKAIHEDKLLKQDEIEQYKNEIAQFKSKIEKIKPEFK